MKKNNNIKKIACALSISLALTPLAGCKKQEKNEYKDENTNYFRSEIVLENKTFEPGEHIIQCLTKNDEMFDYSDGTDNIEFYETGVSYIDGYELIDVSPWTIKWAYGSKTYGFVYTFVNTSIVECTPAVDSDTGNITYPNPGKVIDDKLTLK